MSKIDEIVAEFERTLPATRRYLERIPEDRLTWRPAAKSMSLGQLALHIAMAPGVVAEMSVQDSAVLPEFGQPPQPATRREVSDALEHSAETVRHLLPGMSDERLSGELTFTVNGQAAASMNRGVFLRDILLNHTYHHRGQLSVYFRELGVPVPSSFGPTADEMRPPEATNDQ